MCAPTGMDYKRVAARGLILMSMAMNAAGESRHITFRVMTEIPLPVGEQVFVTGNQPALGEWNAEGFPLTRVDDRVWSAAAMLPADRKIEFKITRGSWATEALQADGIIPANRVLEPDGDLVVDVRVPQWKDSAPPPTPQIVGDYRVHEGFHSRYLRFDRKVIVWLPPSYEQDAEKRYPVLYMQDGQQVFDPLTSTWRHDWQVDEWCTQLIGEYRMEEIIVVAVYSTEDRYLEYNPSMAGREYSRFVMEELKPFIDGEYRTQPGRETTAIAGSSMGATIAFYIAWTQSHAFSAAACLSPAFRFRNDEYCLQMVRKASAPMPDLRLYLYCGEGDALEKELMGGMREMEGLLKERGFEEERNLKVSEDPAAAHNEESWAGHTDDWLLFLFGR